MPSELIDEKKDKIFLCRYKVENLIFSYNGTKLIFDESQIMSIEKLDDYEFNIRSILKLKLRMDVRKKLWTMKYKRDIKVKLELNKIGQTREVEEMIVGPEESINMIFSLRLNDEDEAVDTKLMFEAMQMNEKDYFKQEELEKEDYFDAQNMVDVYLFNDKLLTASLTKYNEVITSGTLQNIVGRILTKTKHRKVLMSRIENTQTYQELLVPAYSAYKALTYLDQYYGLYKFGAMIYYDLDTLYIINPNGKLTAKVKDEWTETTFLVSIKDQSIPGNAMVRKPGQKINYCNITEEDLNPQMPSVSKNEELGSEAKVVIADGTEVKLSEADQTYMNERFDYVRYIREDDNKYTGTILKARMEENETIMYVSAQNLDLNVFALNKTYKFIFEDESKQKKYGKLKWRISYAYHFIRHETEGYMISSHRFIFKKCSK